MDAFFQFWIRFFAVIGFLAVAVGVAWLGSFIAMKGGIAI